MAVVTLKYIRNKGQIKAHLRYITHRRGEEGEKITRTIFNETGLTEKEAVYRMIDNTRRGTLFYKLMISPDPVREDRNKDLDLPHIVRLTVLRLEKQLGRHLRFVATVHDDHTDKRHVHGIFLLQGRVSKERFKALAKTARLAATQEARLQRAGRERVRTHPQYQRLARFVRVVRQGRGVKPQRTQSACPSCGYGQFSGIPSHRVYCPVCHTRLKERTAGLELEVRA